MEALNLLAFDTSKNKLKIVISFGNKDYPYDFNYGFSHIENLLPIINSSFEELKVNKNNLTHIGVCIGPGSFTGLRIGIATALGLSFGSKIILFGFSAFDIYKYLFRDYQDTLVIPLIDARKEKFYCTFISTHDKMVMYDYSLTEIIEKIKTYPVSMKKIFVGEDFNLIKGLIKDTIKYESDFSQGYGAIDVMQYIKWLIRENKNLSEAKPIYLRKSEAETLLIQKISETKQ